MEVFTLTKRKRTKSEAFLTYLFLALTILFIIAGVITVLGFLGFLVAAIFAFIWYRYQFCHTVEFEFSYFDGDFKLIRIKNMSRRKKILLFNIEEVIQIAPAGDRSVYKYENDPNVKMLRCYSMEADAKPYDVVVKQQNNVTVCQVEMDDKMLDSICMKYAQRVIRRKEA